MLLQYVGVVVMSDEIPDAERTIIVEEAHLLHEQIEFSENEFENADNDIEAAYHQTRVQETQELAADLEGDGLRESRVREMKQSAAEKANEFDEETEESARVVAKLDTAKQTLSEYFGDGPTEVEVAQMTGYQNGAVEFRGVNGSAVLTFPDEAQARGAADAILDCNGIEDEAAKVGMR